MRVRLKGFRIDRKVLTGVIAALAVGVLLAFFTRGAMRWLGAFIVGLVVVFTAPFAYRIFNAWNMRRRIEQDFDNGVKLNDELAVQYFWKWLDNLFFAMGRVVEINLIGKMLYPSSKLVLGKNESVLFSAPSTLCETRAVRRYQGGSITVRACRGVSVSNFSGTAYSTDVRRQICDGEFVLTNKRVAFIGNGTQRSFPISKVMSANNFANGVEIASSTQKKTMFFKGFNGYIVGRILNAGNSVLSYEAILTALLGRFLPDTLQNVYLYRPEDIRKIVYSENKKAILKEWHERTKLLCQQEVNQAAKTILGLSLLQPQPNALHQEMLREFRPGVHRKNM